MRTPRQPLPTLLTCLFALGATTACGGMSDSDARDTESNEQSSRSAKKSGGSSSNKTPSESEVGGEIESLDEVAALDEIESPELDPAEEDPTTAASRAAEAEAIDVVVPAIPVDEPRGPSREEAAEEEAEAEESKWGFEVVDDLSVLVIFDNSGSMDAHWDNGSRWDIANRALYDALAPVATSLKVAGIRFPLSGECNVPEFASELQFGWQLAGDFLTAWEEQAVRPVGGTPLGQAFLAADQAIANAQERGLLEDRFNVMVLTDGEPNCNTEPALLTELPAKWLERGVKTHVLGLPGSSAAAQLLQSIAEAGGTEHFVSLGSVDQLGEEVLLRTR